MERQRSSSSSSPKPARTRVVFFSLTLCSPLLLLLLFYCYTPRSYPPPAQLPPLLEAKASGGLPPAPLDVNATQGDVLAGAPDLSQEDDPEPDLQAEEEPILDDAHLAGIAGFRKGGSFALPETEARTAHPQEPCDVYRGRWVFDESYPLYADDACGFVDEGFRCQSNGRPDSDYARWRWQPSECDLPRFDAAKMLEAIRGKRVVFAGDSINRNQWEALLCMLKRGLSDPKRVYEARGRRITKGRGFYSFKFPDYQCSVEYYVTHFLVREGKARVGRRRASTLCIDSIDRTSSRWRGADVLVFNTAHWWSHHKIKSGKNYFQEGEIVHPQLDVATAFRKALTTWASWIDEHVDPRKTTVFFRSSSPSHYSGGEWNSGGHCRESTQPLNGTTTRTSPKLNMVVDQVLKQMRTPVTILNVTAMSGLRIDGHPSVYGKDPRDGSSSRVQDCSHWCLPGVPDAWNELLYYHLLSKHKSSSAGHGIL